MRSHAVPGSHMLHVQSGHAAFMLRIAALLVLLGFAATMLAASALELIALLKRPETVAFYQKFSACKPTEVTIPPRGTTGLDLPGLPPNHPPLDGPAVPAPGLDSPTPGLPPLLPSFDPSDAPPPAPTPPAEPKPAPEPAPAPDSAPPAEAKGETAAEPAPQP